MEKGREGGSKERGREGKRGGKVKLVDTPPLL